MYGLAAMIKAIMLPVTRYDNFVFSDLLGSLFILYTFRGAGCKKASEKDCYDKHAENVLESFHNMCVL